MGLVGLGRFDSVGLVWFGRIGLQGLVLHVLFGLYSAFLILNH